MMKKTEIIFFGLFFFFGILSNVSGQTFADLSVKQIKRAKSKEAQWFPHAQIMLKDSQLREGLILYAADSGLTWLDGAFTPEPLFNPHFIPASQIETYNIKRAYQLGPRMLKGTLAGSFLFGGFVHSFYDELIYDSGYGRGQFSRMVFGFGALTGASIGLLQSLIMGRDFKKQHQLQQSFSAKDLWGLNSGALYIPSRYRRLVHKRDSLYQDLKEHLFLKKLQPQHEGIKLEVSLAVGQANLFRLYREFNRNPRILLPVNLSGAESNYYAYGYSGERPNFSEIRLLYRFKPWLKVGLQTTKTEQTSGDRSLFNDHIDGSLRVVLKHNRAWGAVVEFTPKPTYFLRLRRWDFNAGAGVFMESIRFSHDIRGRTVQTSSPEYFQIKQEETFYLPAFLGYGAITWHAFPFLSFQTRFGYHRVQKAHTSDFELPLGVSVPEVSFAGTTLNLSRQHYSFGMVVRI